MLDCLVKVSQTLLPDKYRFQEGFAIIQVLFSFLVAAVQLNVGEDWKSGLHAWTQRVDRPDTRLYQCTLSVPMRHVEKVNSELRPPSQKAP